jgi:hypothetical protein
VEDPGELGLLQVNLQRSFHWVFGRTAMRASCDLVKPPSSSRAQAKRSRGT